MQNIKPKVFMFLGVMYAVYALTFPFTAKASTKHNQTDRNKINKIDSHASQNAYTTLTYKLFKQPYKTLPTYPVSPKHFGKKGQNPNNALLAAALRTLTSNADWLEDATKPKLFNANGICFTGTWHINTDNQYTGLFQKGVYSSVIARASVALSGTHKKHKRAFGVALKLFNPEHTRSANMLTMHSLAGIKTQSILDLTLDNEPALTGLPPLTHIPTLLRINKDLKRADNLTSTPPANVNYRSVKQLAAFNYLGAAVAPKWVKLTPTTLFRASKNDFRDELDLSHYPNNKIEYAISVSIGKQNKKKHAVFKIIGTLNLTQSVRSAACDINLHFPHPKGSSS